MKQLKLFTFKYNESCENRFAHDTYTNYTFEKTLLAKSKKDALKQMKEFVKKYNNNSNDYEGYISNDYVIIDIKNVNQPFKVLFSDFI